MRIECGDWALDTATRQIARGGENVHVSPKAFDLLTTLLLERPRALSKSELLVRLWPDVFVSEATLASLVAEVRSALGDSARNPRCVRTVQRYGYAFCGTVTEGDPTPPPSSRAAGSARLAMGKREVALSEGANLLGRLPEASFWIDSGGVSRRHARITVTADGASIEDLGSKNGTFVNGERVSDSRALSDGDEIRLGRVRMVFRAFAAPPSTETEAD
jgi:DNA-binding winged helix-turn-helix (wHTH) protein